MTKGRSTTWQERIEIVQECLAADKDYHQTSEKNGVSYQQVYSWVKKYEVGGWDALKDRRRRSKNSEELSKDEKLKLEIRHIEKDNERLRAENAILKKDEGNRKKGCITRVRHESRYLAIQEVHEEEGLPIYLLCEVAKVSRAA